MATNLTLVENTTNFADFTVELNTATGGYFSLFILFVIFFIGVLTMRRIGYGEAFMASSFITSVIGILFVFLQIAAFTKVIYFIILFIFSLVYVVWKNN